MDDIFSSVVDAATSSIDGVVSSTINGVANNVTNTVMGYVDTPLGMASSAITNTATNIGQTIAGDFGGQFMNSLSSSVTNSVSNAVSGAVSNAINSSDLMRSIRSFSLFGNGGSGMGSFVSGSWLGGGNDWRVRLSIPMTHNFMSSSILGPLYETDYSLVFPYTPNIIVNSTAKYNSLAPTHNNYAYPAYESSAVEQITITGEFSAENPIEAEYWVAANHYLRSVSKMAYGESTTLGTPPPVVRLNGYGDFVFKDVPVVVESFMMNLPKDVDYIKADVGPGGSWVPTLSEISVTLRVAYSRDSVNKFSLDSFVAGEYLAGGSKGFI